MLRLPALGLKYAGEPKQLRFFLTQVWNYVQEYRADMATKVAQVWCMTMVLEATAAEWMVSPQ